MNDLIRCVDTKTGKEKFLPPKVANDKKLMASYNLIIQDPKEEKKKVAKIIEVSQDHKEVIEEKEEFEEIGSTETVIEKPKRGPKPKLTE